MESDNHSRTIVFIELDDFFNKVDKLTESAIGIHQKYLVLTNNYVTREYKIKNCVQVSEALKSCPKVKVPDDCEEIHDYWMMLQKVEAVINKFTTYFESGCMDQYFIDVSKLVQNRLQAHLNVRAIGHIYGAENCECGCVERLNMGSVIASEIRESIKSDLGFTCSAGIAHNKLLAKLAGAVNTPNQQTIVYPSCADQLLFSLRDLFPITAICPYLRSLESLNIQTIKDLRICSMDTLKKTFGVDKAKALMDFSYGKDQSPVFPNEQPLTIRFSSRMVEKNIRDQFLQLLHRLMNRVMIDGRIPRTIQVSLRKYDFQRKTSHKKHRSLNISPSLFIVANTVNLTQYGQDKLMGIIMNLFHKLVDITIPYHVTILGLAFTKFQERQNTRNSVAALLMNNMSVQSVTSLQSGNQPSRESLRMDYSPVSHTSLDVNTDGSESEIEPSPKKAKFDSLMAKRRCLDNSAECPSPSKLRVAELRLSSRESEKSPENNQCPQNVDTDVFKELPEDMQNELLQQWKTEN